MRGEGPRADQIKNFFSLCAKKFHFNEESLELSTEHFKRVTDQMSFDLD
jgi:hypothetical protein